MNTRPPRPQRGALTNLSYTPLMLTTNEAPRLGQSVAVRAQDLKVLIRAVRVVCVTMVNLQWYATSDGMTFVPATSFATFTTFSDESFTSPHTQTCATCFRTLSQAGFPFGVPDLCGVSLLALCAAIKHLRSLTTDACVHVGLARLERAFSSSRTRRIDQAFPQPVGLRRPPGTRTQTSTIKSRLL